MTEDKWALNSDKLGKEKVSRTLCVDRSEDSANDAYHGFSSNQQITHSFLESTSKSYFCLI